MMKKNKSDREDLKGFEDFIEEPKSSSLENKKEVSFEHLTFLENDAKRLQRLKKIHRDKLPLMKKNSQHELLTEKQKSEISVLKEMLFQTFSQENSGIRQNLIQLFDVFR